MSSNLGFFVLSGFMRGITLNSIIVENIGYLIGTSFHLQCKHFHQQNSSYTDVEHSIQCLKATKGYLFYESISNRKHNSGPKLPQMSPRSNVSSTSGTSMEKFNADTSKVAKVSLNHTIVVFMLEGPSFFTNLHKTDL